MATLSEISVGDTVSWSIPKDPDPPSTVHGVITSINRDEETANMRVWSINEDGSHDQTDRTVTQPVSKLRIIKDFREEKQVSARIERILRDKVEAHNDKNPRHRATLRMLEAVFRRGVGAYRTNPASVRGNVRSADQWALARVNAFMTGLRTGRFPRTAFDRDLLPRSHPLSSKKNYKAPYDDLDFTIPQGAKEEAKRALDWVSEFNRGGTSVGRGTARYLLSNTIASPNKVRQIARYFPRHEIDKRAEGYRPGEDGYPSNGRIAWALWGGEAGKSWSNKLVKGMNIRDEKTNSVTEMVIRKSRLKQLEKKERLERFNNQEIKDILWKNYDSLLRNWDLTLGVEYYKLFTEQNKVINEFIKNNSLTTVGNLTILNNLIDNQTIKWSADLYDLYLSMTTDFGFNQIEILLPEEFKFTEEEQEQIQRQRRRKPRQEVITEGFYPLRGRRGVRIPISDFRRNRTAIDFVSNRLDTVLPDLAKTTKDRLNRDLRRSVTEATNLGLRGKDLEDYVANGISDALGKKRLGRASTIARTEGLALSQFGQDLAVTQSGLTLEKEWVATRDGVTRDTHRLADGQRINKNGFFSVGGYNMLYPSDSSGGAPANETINCRCTVIYHEVL
tara:strand:- start:4318 stop:6171 length:1854 start_codon:yes stop_codon:yes gene_type:complete